MECSVGANSASSVTFSRMKSQMLSTTPLLHAAIFLYMARLRVIHWLRLHAFGPCVLRRVHNGSLSKGGRRAELSKSMPRNFHSLLLTCTSLTMQCWNPFDVKRRTTSFTSNFSPRTGGGGRATLGFFAMGCAGAASLRMRICSSFHCFCCASWARRAFSNI